MDGEDNDSDEESKRSKVVIFQTVALVLRFA